MVVLEEGSMLTTGHNQYLQPDYLSPLPTTVSIAPFLLPIFASRFVGEKEEKVPTLQTDFFSPFFLSTFLSRISHLCLQLGDG